MANFWDFSKGNSNIINMFQSFMKNGGMNNMNNLGQIQQMMQMANCKNPEELVRMIAKQKGISDNDLNEIIKMAKNMSK